MLDVLIIQHEDDTPPGSALEWAQAQGLSTQVWRIDKNDARPVDIAKFKALIVCGGTMDTFEEDKHPWLKTEKAFLKECIQAQKPIFGLCLGSQLLAEVLGGRSYPYNKWEIGFVPVQLLDESPKKTLQVFHWHQCTFDLPPGAELLATNDFCKNQAFTWGKNIIATQFHPEASDAWVKECADSVEDGRTFVGVVQNKKEMLESISLRKPMQDWFFAKLTKWFPTT
jgi:GMP synthase-like glutamine amidotransferase